MRPTISITSIVLIVFFHFSTFASESFQPGIKNELVHELVLSTVSVKIEVPVKSWRLLRDARVVKQTLDYSCGAASLVTVLNEFYGQSISEEELLKAMDKGHLQASFDDMQKVLPQFGFKAQGFASSYAQLSKLKLPVVLFLKHRNEEHFSVLRGIDSSSVWLADPSFGNRTFSKEQFIEMWKTRNDELNPELVGKFLAILPLPDKSVTYSDFFTNHPGRQSRHVVEQLVFRHFP